MEMWHLESSLMSWLRARTRNSCRYRHPWDSAGNSDSRQCNVDHTTWCQQRCHRMSETKASFKAPCGNALDSSLEALLAQHGRGTPTPTAFPGSKKPRKCSFHILLAIYGGQVIQP
ncbi:hypothetical protein V7S43_013621 [Phytophthora oleae]|uniref:Uncharacterized protein n=1 Tax=Phytophthora oleae TaxID=2107226 RepID=A0ABD3F3W7_9STRA